KARARLDGKPCAGRCRGPSISGGDDQRRGTRVAGATGALAAGASRSRCRDLRLAALAGLRSVASPAPKKAQTHPARSDFLHRGPTHSRHYCLRPRFVSAHSGSMPASRMTLVQRSVSSRLNFVISWGLPPPALNWRAGTRVLFSGGAAASLFGGLSLKMTGAGVLGGALIAFKVPERKPAPPISMKVGRSGR